MILYKIKLLLKTLFLIFTLLFTTVGEVKSSAGANAVSGERYAVCGIAKSRRLRAATSAGGADEVVRWDSCRLDFFATFLVKQKSREKKMPTFFPKEKIKPINNKL